MEEYSTYTLNGSSDVISYLYESQDVYSPKNFRIEQLFNQNLICPRYRISVLNQDETVSYVIPEEDICDGGSYNENYQNGIRRTLSFSLYNQTGKYNPSINSIWFDTKILYEIAIEDPNNPRGIIWVKRGVYLISDFSLSYSGQERKIDFQCNDKFTIWESKLGSITDALEIETGAIIENIIDDILKIQDGAGNILDPIPFLYHSSFKGKKTPLKLSESAGSNYASLLKQLAEVLSAEIFYNSSGMLTIIPQNEVISDSDKGSIFDYFDYNGDMLDENFSINFGDIVNRIIVVGSNVNGHVARAEAKNENSDSPYSISRIGIRTDIINDSNITNDILAQERANYELRKILIARTQFGMNVLFNPLLLVNNVITVTEDVYGLNKERFLIQTISHSIDYSGTMSITTANLNNFSLFFTKTSDIPVFEKDKQYLYFVADQANSTVSIEMVTTSNDFSDIYIETSTDRKKWEKYIIGTTVTLTNAGDSVYFRGNNKALSSGDDKYYHFVMSGNISAYGNIMSLLDENCELNEIPSEYCFYGLFKDCSNLYAAPELPAETLNDNCYSHMFEGCTNLTTAPKLPARNLNISCYDHMFSDCITLLFTPELHATTLAESCYEYMFNGCKMLTYLPELPAVELKQRSYYGMFNNCSGIKLSVTQDDDYLYQYRIPTVGTGTEDSSSLSNMFSGTGGNFTGTPSINTIYYTTHDVLSYLCFTSEVANSTITMSKIGNLSKVPVLFTSRDKNVWTLFTIGETVITLKNVGDKVYFYGVNNYISESFNNYCKFVMTGRIAASGNIMSLLDKKSLTGYSYCFCNLFDGCASLTNAPELPATTLSNGCYQYMFYGCTNLTTAPELPATTLAETCYNHMFDGCTSLVSATELPATTLKLSCYYSMFMNCTNLTTAPELPATTLAIYCYASMFQNCTNLTTAPELPATTLAIYCYAYMFDGCTNLTTLPELPAKTLLIQCYYNMFNNCSGIKLSVTQNDDYPYPYRIPAFGTGTEGSSSLSNMFAGTGGTFQGTPEINTTYYTTQGTLPYLCFTSEEENSTIAMSKIGNLSKVPVLFTSNDQITWTLFNIGETVITLKNVGDKVYFRGVNNYISESSYNYCKFVMTGKIAASGNVMSLLDKYCARKSLTGYSYCFCHLFNGCTSLTNAPELPATTLASYCYYSMFSGCTSLTTAPELPATTLKLNCYYRMFMNCTNLKIASELPARNLDGSCYEHMFSGCTNLVSAPELPATTLASYCYDHMFSGCTSLTAAPELPATTLAIYCYQYMFDGCTNLTAFPELPAKTLLRQCYYNMFRNCSGIKLSVTQDDDYPYPYRIPTVGTGTEGSSSLSDMFAGTGGTFQGTPEINTTYYTTQGTLPYLCFTSEVANSTITMSKFGNLSTTPDIETSNDQITWTRFTIGETVITLENVGDSVYFRGVNNYISESSYNYCKFVMTGKIAASGNVMSLLDKYCARKSLTGYSYCFCHLFNGCTSLTTAPELPATILAEACYQYMFYGCTNLTTAPELPATILSEACYQYMFRNCTNLTTAPELPATTLATYCYSSMFNGCTSLTNAPELPATTLSNGCYDNMFRNCTSLTTAPELPATTLATYCYASMFQNCTNLTTAPELPATTLASYCYYSMFNNCSGIKLSVTQTGNYIHPYRIPTVGTGTEGRSSLSDMFYGTGGTFQGTPEINTTYYTSNEII